MSTEATIRAVVLEQVGEGVIIADAEGCITFVNDAASRLHGVAQLGVAVEGWTETYHLLTMEGDPYPPEELPLARALLRRETVPDALWRIRRPDGSMVVAQGTATPLADPNGEPLGAVLVVRDVTERERLLQELRELAARQRQFLREMLLGFTEGKLRLCDGSHELPVPLSPAAPPVALNAKTMRSLRKQADSVARDLGFLPERLQDLETAIGEAAMNAVRHAGGGQGQVHVDRERGQVQVWVRDGGSGIAEDLIHRAVERNWTTGGFGQGFYLMLKTCDRVYLLTGPGGTTVVLEQEREEPIPAWLAEPA